MAEESLEPQVESGVCTKKACLPVTYAYIVCGDNICVTDSDGNKASYSKDLFNELFDKV